MTYDVLQREAKKEILEDKTNPPKNRCPYGHKICGKYCAWNKRALLEILT
jgi:hypothetical protein